MVMEQGIIWAGDRGYKTIQFEWFLTNWCNYACSYCSEADNMTDDYVKSNIGGSYRLVLERLRRLDSDFTVELIGGEPTLHPDILEILTELDGMEHCVRVEIMTNLSRGVEFFRKLSLLGLSKLWIMASHHPEFTRADFSSPVWLEYFGDKFGVIMNMIDKPEYWDDIEGLIQLFEQRGINYSLNLLHSTRAYRTGYGDEFWARFGDYFKRSASTEYTDYCYDTGLVRHSENEIILGKLNRFRGYRCRPMRYRITHTGDIANWCHGGSVGLRLTGAELTAETTCINDSCRCTALYVFYKERT